MKSIYKKIGILTTIFFAFGIILIAYFLYNLPQALQNQVAAIDYDTIEQMKPVLNQLYWTTGAVLILGLLSLVIIIFNDRLGDEDNIVYVEAFNEKGKKNQDAKDENKDGLEDSLKEIKKAIEDNKADKQELDKVLSLACKKLKACQGALYISRTENERKYIELIATFAHSKAESQSITFEIGEGLAGQVAKEGKAVNLKSVPDGYIQILSGLGSSSPQHLLLVPILNKGELKGVVEIASFTEFKPKDEAFIHQVCEILGNSLKAEVEEKKSRRKINLEQ